MLIFKRKYFSPLFIFVIMATAPLAANSNLRLYSGFGYMEHYSIGIGSAFNNKSSISLHYGSNFFIHPRKFSSLLLQYEYRFEKIKIHQFHFCAGLKGGYSIYTNEYYRLDLINLMPYLGSVYSLSERFSLGLNLGLTLSHEMSMQRIALGEIGYYRELLPEFKIVLSYDLF